MSNTITERNTKVLLTEKALQEVKVLLNEQLPEHVYFHNESYLDQVIEATQKLAEDAELDKAETEVLNLAAIFHVVGYIGGGKNSWKKSSEAATEFLLSNNADADTIASVDKLINALDPKYKPDTLLEKLYLDAQLSYYGDKDFLNRISRLQKEQEAGSKEKKDEVEWTGELIEQLRSHAYLTSQAEGLFGKVKEKNLKKLKKSLKNELKVRLEGDKSSSISANSGARTMFKTALRNHVDLTSIADQKANIMLSINALIITIGLPAFATYLPNKSFLIAPAVIFLLTSVATMIVATISTRPIKVDGLTDLTQLKSGKTNLFFFGNFYSIPNEQYREAIKDVVADRDYLDSSFVNDLYFLGVSLGQKFKLLRLCYNVFVFGLCLSVLAFALSYFISVSN